MNYTKYLFIALIHVTYDTCWLLRANDDLLAEVTQGLENSLAKVKSIRADFVYEYQQIEKGRITTEKGSFIRRGSDELYTQNKNGIEFYKKFSSGVIYDLALLKEQTKSDRNVGSIRPIHSHVGPLHVFLAFNIDQRDPDTRVCSYRDMVLLYGSNISATSEIINGKRYILVTRHHPTPSGKTSQVMQWHDVENGYWVTKSKGSIDSDTYYQDSITQFSTLADGSKFPARLEGIHTKNGKPFANSTFTLINPVFNSEISPKELAIPNPPAGTEIIDQIQGVVGKSDGSWKITGPTRPFQLYVIPSSASSESSTKQGEATNEEPFRYGTLFLLASIACGILALFAVLLKRYRATKV